MIKYNPITNEVKIWDGTNSLEINSDGKAEVIQSDQIDTTTNALKMVAFSHAELHTGTHYVVKDWDSVAKNGTRDILVITPDSAKWAHVTIEIGTSASVIVASFYEDAVTSADGTESGTFNRNRNFPDSNTTIVYDSPTITSVGTLLNESYVGTGKNVGGGVRDGVEIVLKQNTKYLLRLTEQNIAKTAVGWVIDWYEHTNI